ncbi:MAG: hypothetical protein GY763_11440 [Gammaproteobacteria bacterium]|nr:hypothetical protein [Gammaproteobacteria bacterium]
MLNAGQIEFGSLIDNPAGQLVLDIELARVEHLCCMKEEETDNNKKPQKIKLGQVCGSADHRSVMQNC